MVPENIVTDLSCTKESNGAVHFSYVNYHLKSEESIMLYFQLCSTHYTAIKIKNYSKSTSVIKVAAMKNTDDFRYA